MKQYYYYPPANTTYSLVCAIKERKQVMFLDGFTHFFPLLQRRIHTSRIMSACQSKILYDMLYNKTEIKS